MNCREPASKQQHLGLVGKCARAAAPTSACQRYDNDQPAVTRRPLFSLRCGHWRKSLRQASVGVRSRLHGFEGHFLERLALQLRRDRGEERIRCDERADGYMQLFSSFIVSAIHSQGLMRFMTMNPIVKPTAKTSS
jgi:hypothetical protein